MLMLLWLYDVLRNMELKSWMIHMIRHGGHCWKWEMLLYSIRVKAYWTVRLRDPEMLHRHLKDKFQYTHSFSIKSDFTNKVKVGSITCIIIRLLNTSRCVLIRQGFKNLQVQAFLIRCWWEILLIFQFRWFILIIVSSFQRNR